MKEPPINGGDRVYGGPGNDFVEASDGPDYVEGDDGDDVLHASYRCDFGNSGGAGTVDRFPNELFGVQATTTSLATSALTLLTVARVPTEVRVVIATGGST